MVVSFGPKWNGREKICRNVLFDSGSICLSAFDWDMFDC